MPMIDTYAAAIRFSDPRILAINAAAVIKTADQVPDIPMFRKGTSTFVHELPPSAIANFDRDGNCARIQVLTNAGAPDCKKQITAVRQLTDLLATAADDPSLVDRTWVLLSEAALGGWGLWDHPQTNQDLVGAVKAKLAKLRA